MLLDVLAVIESAHRTYFKTSAKTTTNPTFASFSSRRIEQIYLCRRESSLR